MTIKPNEVPQKAAKAYEAGKAAAMRGDAKASNPYRRRQFRAVWWDMGYDAHEAASMEQLSLLIALESLWQEWSAARLVIAATPKKERELRAWFCRNPRVIDRALAGKPYNFI